MKPIALMSCAAALIGMAALAAPKGEQAQIPFATTGGIDGWRVVDDDTIYIRSRDNRWYRADLFGPCMGLRFDPTIGFVVRFGSTFDRSSSLLVEGRECKLSSLVEVEGPPTEKAGRSQAEAPTQGARTEDRQSGTSSVANTTPSEGNAAAPSGSAQPAASETGATAPSDDNGKRQEQARSGDARGGDARIPFANLGGIRDWRAVGDQVLYIQGRNNQWYRAQLFSPCTGLQFEESIGFVAEPSGSFDRFSSIVVDGRECPVASLTQSDGPPPSSRSAAAPPEGE